MKKKNKTDKLNYYDEMMTMRHLHEEISDIKDQILTDTKHKEFDKDTSLDHLVTFNKMRIKYSRDNKMLEIIDELEIRFNKILDDLDSYRSTVLQVSLDLEMLMYNDDPDYNLLTHSDCKMYLDYCEKTRNDFIVPFTRHIEYIRKHNITDESEHIQYHFDEEKHINRIDEFQKVLNSYKKPS